MNYITYDLSITDQSNITGVFRGGESDLPNDAMEVTEAQVDALFIDRSKYQVSGAPLILGPLADGIQLSDVKAGHIRTLSSACHAQIRAGWVASELGAAHRYDTDKAADQTNLLAAGLGGVDIDYTCTDIATETKMPRAHTAAQIRRVFEKARDEKVRLVGLYHTLRGQVEAVAITTTLEAAQTEINAIAWTG